MHVVVQSSNSWSSPLTFFKYLQPHKPLKKRIVWGEKCSIGVIIAKLLWFNMLMVNRSSKTQICRDPFWHGRNDDVLFYSIKTIDSIIITSSRSFQKPVLERNSKTFEFPFHVQLVQIVLYQIPVLLCALYHLISFNSTFSFSINISSGANQNRQLSFLEAKKKTKQTQVSHTDFFKTEYFVARWSNPNKPNGWQWSTAPGEP